MSDKHQQCIICEGTTGGSCSTHSTGKDSLGFACEACGTYAVVNSLVASWRSYELSARQRAVLSHRIRTTDRSSIEPMITTYWMDDFLKEVPALPNPAMQAVNIVRTVGDHINQTGAGYFIDDVRMAPLVGSFNRDMFNELLNELFENGTLTRGEIYSEPNPRGHGVLSGRLTGLSLNGWTTYEAEQRGKVAGKFGFIAMKFNAEELETLTTETIKPRIRAELGYSVVDLRDQARAGIIDNILREQIRDSAFVLVDLTHDNSGAYWEAGYAEGLGKPVIYLCQREKFDEVKPHFDTNHSTTVLWQIGHEERFIERPSGNHTKVAESVLNFG